MWLPDSRLLTPDWLRAEVNPLTVGVVGLTTEVLRVLGVG
jgi:hypothetical protein